MALTPGARLGSYEILSLIGSGGMGEVYRARDHKLDRDVAIKVSPDSVAADSERLARLEREARTLAALNHPNIAHIYGVEDSSGRPALVMELVEGPTLADRIARGPIAIGDALPIATQIAEALEVAHEQGIIHRDLKPANIKVRDDGTVKVLDFGLAKALGSDGARGPVGASRSPTITSPATMTGVGVLLGTAAYMSPEQARGKPVDKRADIWAFGCVLFEMLTGRRAFGGDEVSDTLAFVITKEVDWSALSATTPLALRRVLRRCLEKDPAKRLRDIADARIEIGEVEIEPSAVVPSATLTPVRRARLVSQWAVVAVAIATAGVLGALLVRHREPASLGIVRFSMTPSDDLAFGNPTFGRGLSAPAPHFAPSPDGRQIAYVAYKADKKAQLWVRRLDTLATTALSGSDDASFPFWSPDSRFLAFFAQGKLKRIDVSGGPPLTICDAPAGEGGTWNRDGVIVFAPDDGSGLFRVSTTGGGATPLTKLDAARGELTHRWPQFLPDGRHFLYLAMSAALAPSIEMPSIERIPGENQPSIYVGSIDSDDRTSILRGALRAMYGSEHLLFLRDATLMAQPFDPQALRLSGDPIPIAEGVANNTGNGRTGFSVSDNGVLTYRTGIEISGRSVLAWFDRSGRQLTTVGAPADYLEARLSADGRTVAAVIADVPGKGVYQPGPQSADLWILDLTRNAIAARLTFQANQPKLGVAWSPDGNLVVFGALDGPGGGVFAQRTTGVGETERLFVGEGPVRPTSWSPDGRYVAFNELSVRRTHVDLWVLPMFGGGKAAALLKSAFNHQSGAFSPDGRWIAYASDQGGALDVYVRGFPTGDREWRISQNGGNFPQWRADGRELFYFAQTGALMAVPIGSGAVFDPGTPVKLFDARLRGGGFGQYSATPDGQRFLIISPLAVADRQTGTDQTPIQVVLNWQEELKARVPTK